MQAINSKTGRILALVIASLFASGSALAEKPEWAGHNKDGKDGRGEQREGRNGQRDEDRDHGENRSQDQSRGHEENHAQDHNRDHDQNRGHHVRMYQNRDDDARAERHFDEQRWTFVRDYYSNQYRSGRCPPGLAKKHNGCVPPGHARRWEIGRPLPREVIFYEVPQPLVIQLGYPPRGYRYVRVASDILMIAVGTALVVDAIEDLGVR